MRRTPVGKVTRCGIDSTGSPFRVTEASGWVAETEQRRGNGPRIHVLKEITSYERGVTVYSAPGTCPKYLSTPTAVVIDGPSYGDLDVCDNCLKTRWAWEQFKEAVL